MGHVERISGPRPSGLWGFVVRADGRALEVLVLRTHGALGIALTLLHERCEWPAGASVAPGKTADICPSCDLVGGACRSHGLFHIVVREVFDRHRRELPAEGFEPLPELLWKQLELLITPGEVLP